MDHHESPPSLTYDDHEDRLHIATLRLSAARDEERTASRALATTVRIAHAAGLTKYRIRQITGLARATIDKWTD